MIARYEKELREAYDQLPRETEETVQTERSGKKEAEAAMPLSPQPSERPFPEESPEKAENIHPETDNGNILVSTKAARGAVPLEGVAVLVDRDSVSDPVHRQELIRLLETDQSGKTKSVSVKTVSRELSLVPGNQGPFVTYYVSTRLQGYLPVDNLPVDVFGGQTSLLDVELVPEAENLTGGESTW